MAEYIKNAFAYYEREVADPYSRHADTPEFHLLGLQLAAIKANRPVVPVPVPVESGMAGVIAEFSPPIGIGISPVEDSVNKDPFNEI